MENKICIIKEINIFRFARYYISENSDLNKAIKPQEYDKYINDKIEDLIKNCYRNCKNPNHFGGCRISCNCGCPEGKDLCLG